MKLLASAIAVLGFLTFVNATLAAELSSTWRTDSPPYLNANNGHRLRVDIPLGILAAHPSERLYQSTDLNQLGNGALALTMGCKAQLDSKILLQSATAFLKDRDLKVQFSSRNGRQVLVISEPKMRGANARFYTYSAELSACIDECNLKVEAHLVTAPVAGDTLMLSLSKLGDDDISYKLMALADPCKRS